jgi:hypothetical protein
MDGTVAVGEAGIRLGQLRSAVDTGGDRSSAGEVRVDGVETRRGAQLAGRSSRCTSLT